MLENYSLVRLLTDKHQSEGACRGNIGHIIEVYGDGACEVAFADAHGCDYAQIVAHESDLEIAVDVERMTAMLEASGDDRYKRCASALRDGTAEAISGTGHAVPVKETRDIYYRRAKWNNFIGNPTQGFDGLVTGLAQSTAISVHITVVRVTDTHARQFAVFTDGTQSEILGLLEWPPDVVGLEDTASLGA